VCPCSLDLAEHFSENTTYRYAVLKVRASGCPQCESLPVRPTAMKVGPPATRGVRTPGPGLSKLNSKAPSRAPRSREVAGRPNRRGVNVISRRAPSTRTFTLGGGTEPDGMSGVHRGTACGGRRVHRIPRKEVIQPQLPLRLPCYDFTPVTNSTFDCSLPYGLGHRLRVSPASVV
jgi:hypothetical protein